MSEELLKAIIRLFAIVAKERVTDDERANIREFLSQHLNQESIDFYVDLFESYCEENLQEEGQDLGTMDDDTLEFVADWSRIIRITKAMNEALTKQQKVVLVIKIIELVFADGEISERQENLIFYIGEALKISRKDIQLMERFVFGSDHEELSDSNILLIDEGSGEMTGVGPKMVAKNLTGLLAIMRLADIETYFIKYLGISSLSLNSIPLKSRKIVTFPTGSTIRGNKIQTIYYSNVVSRFLTKSKRPRISFEVEHLFFHFKSGKAALQNVSFREEGGKLIGLMGASGAGKSTLLHVLNGSEKPSGGRVLINGINLHETPEKLRGVIGFVPQDDLLIEELTVYENLYYATRLCYGNDTEEQLLARVDKVLASLGLIEIKELKVGNPIDKTISGGQRKRVNIGLELLREPTILYVDEPTSGLSSRDSENIMDLLKELSLRGKMVFVVIHQPSSDIFKMFDSLLILDVGGYPIYYGNPTEAVVYFKEIVNAVNKSQGACPECGNINPEQVFNIIETRIVNEYGRLTDTRKISPVQWYHYFKEKVEIAPIETIKQSLPVSQQIPGRWAQWKVFITRDVRSKWADKQYLLINLLEAPVLALFMAFMVRYYAVFESNASEYSFFSNENIPVYFFMSIIVALFMGLTVSAEEIFRDRKILKREKFLHLSRGTYLASKVLLLFGISALQTLLFVWIGNYVLEIPDMNLRFWLILFSSACFANLLGLNISASFNSAVTIYILIPLLLIPQLLLSGVVIRFDKFNPWVSSEDRVPLAGDMMASRWAFEAAMVSQFKDNPFEKEWYDLEKQAANAEYKKLYYLPKLESELSFCFQALGQRTGQDGARMKQALQLLHSELGLELERVGQTPFAGFEKLRVQAFDTAVYRQTSEFLAVLNRYYVNQFNQAVAKREARIAALEAQNEGLQGYEYMRRKYQNEAVMEAVKNTGTPYRIIEYKGRLIRKIYPIYFDEHRPWHVVDYTAKFYVPNKPLFGFHVDTFYFNLVAIWGMILVLSLALYADALKRIITYLEPRRRKKK
jgi:ABC transport system ATP-binding/permease protein